MIAAVIALSVSCEAKKVCTEAPDLCPNGGGAAEGGGTEGGGGDGGAPDGGAADGGAGGAT